MVQQCHYSQFKGKIHIHFEAKHIKILAVKKIASLFSAWLETIHRQEN